MSIFSAVFLKKPGDISEMEPVQQTAVRLLHAVFSIISPCSARLLSLSPSLLLPAKIVAR